MSDADGYTSGAFTYMELKHLNPNLDIKYILHKGKEHGIVLEELFQMVVAMTNNKLKS